MAVPEVLYCGLSGAEADRFSFNPPPGIIRTELIKHPVVQRRRFFAAAAGEPVAVDEEAAEADAKAKAEADAKAKAEADAKAKAEADAKAKAEADAAGDKPPKK